MRQSNLFGKTLREPPKDEVSANAIFLERGGFIYKNSAGIYSYLPLGWRVIQKIAAIIREEMNAIRGQEVFMPALHDKKYLSATGRWDIDVVYKVITGSDNNPHFNISWTHEEIAAEIASRFTESYKNLPFAFYQIQTKFRHEPRAKSGLLRGREFMMKDLYSFHTSEEDLFRYYEEVRGAYLKIFTRCGLNALYTLAGGGDFTLSNTHEFQVVSPVGEDSIFVCSKCGYAENKEISKLGEGDTCPTCGGTVSLEKGIEVGNIFPLGTKYSEAFNLQFVDEKGEKKFVVMGSYGIGLGRVMGTVVEVAHDDKGIIWPESIAPFQAHIVEILGKDESGKGEVKKAAEKLYENLVKKGIEVLYDDREEKTAGEKFADADLIGIPTRIVISPKTLEQKSVEIKKRSSPEAKIVPLAKVILFIK